MKTKKDPDLSHIRQTIDDLDYTINMMRGELRSKDAEVCDLIVEFNEHARAIQQTFYKKTALSLFYGFLFGTGMYLAVFTLENLV